MYLETHQCAYCRTEKNAAQPSYLSRVHRKRLHGGLIFYEIECSCLISGSFLVHLEILENISKNGGKRNYLTLFYYFYFCMLKKCPSKIFLPFLTFHRMESTFQNGFMFPSKGLAMNQITMMLLYMYYHSKSLKDMPRYSISNSIFMYVYLYTYICT